MALSINEEGEEFYEDGLNVVGVVGGHTPHPRDLPHEKGPQTEQEICRNVLQHQRSSRPYRLRRQVSEKKIKIEKSFSPILLGA